MSPVWSLGDLALRLEATLVGASPAARVTGVANPEEATGQDLVFLVSEQYTERVAACQAGACVAAAPVSGKPTLVVPHPRLAMAQTLALFDPTPPLMGRHPDTWIDPTATLAPDVVLGPGVVVGPGASVGAGSVLHAHVVVGPAARVGAACVLHPHVVVRERCVLGDRVILHAGTVIGCDGYGFVLSGGKHHKIPQIGGVEVGDDVEIGSNAAVDRATIGVTRIGRGTKIDNLVHVGHNVHIGEHVLLVAQVGISGSVTLGDRVTMAGQSGAAGHLHVGDDAVVAAKSGVTRDVPRRTMVSGFPARPHREVMRQQAALARLPDLLAEVKALRAEVARLRGETGGTPDA